MAQHPHHRNLSAKPRWPLWVAIAVGLVWCGLFLKNPLWPSDVVPLDSDLNGPRWLLFLVPDQTVGSWFEGPVTGAGLLQRAAVLAVAVVLIGSAAAAGRWIVSAIPPVPGASRLEIAALGTACGLALQSWVTVVMGLFGGVGSLWSGPLIVLVTLGIGYAAARFGSRFGQFVEESSPAVATANRERPADAQPNWAVRIPLWIFVALAGLLVARSMMPPAEYDVREYHLQAPKEWSQEGRIAFMPHNIYANMPMAAEMHPLLAIDCWRWFSGEREFWWWGALSGKLMMAGYAILAAVILGEIVRRLRGPLAGRWTSVFVVSMPALFEGASLGLVEAAVACFFAAGLLVVVAQLRPEASAYGSQQPRSLTAHRASGQVKTEPTALAAGLDGAVNTPLRPEASAYGSQQSRFSVSAAWVGLFAGAAMACKYPALLFVALPLGLACWFLEPIQKPNMRPRSGTDSSLSPRAAGERGRVRGFSERLVGTERPWRAKALRLGCFVLFASLACAPWYLKNAVFAGNPVYPLAASILGGETMSPSKIAQWNEAHQHDGFAVNAVVASAKRLSWQWQTQSMILFPLALVGAVATWREYPIRWILAALALTLLIWWMFTHRIERFIVPSLPLVFVLAGLGWSSLREHFGIRVATLVALVGVGMDGMLVAGPLLGDSRLAVDLAAMRRDEPVGERISRVPEHVRFVNEALSQTDRLLLVGDAAAFDYAVPVDYSTTFDESPLAQVITSHRPGAWGSALRRRNYSHVLVHWGEIERLRSTYGFDSRITRERLSEMEAVGALELVRDDLTGGAVELYRVGDGARGADG